MLKRYSFFGCFRTECMPWFINDSTLLSISPSLLFLQLWRIRYIFFCTILRADSLRISIGLSTLSRRRHTGYFRRVLTTPSPKARCPDARRIDADPNPRGVPAQPDRRGIGEQNRIEEDREEENRKRIRQWDNTGLRDSAEIKIGRVRRWNWRNEANRTFGELVHSALVTKLKQIPFSLCSFFDLVRFR